MRITDTRPDPRPLRILLACILAPWLVIAAAVLLHGLDDARLDVNGEPLSYNAPCSTDMDCAERFP